MAVSLETFPTSFAWRVFKVILKNNLSLDLINYYVFYLIATK